jgi:outer membrane protein OmpA-like peptidoglycan-associated protein
VPVQSHETDRSYRRGAIMGLTMAEALMLICFALLLLLAFWQFEVQKSNTPDVQAFRELSDTHRAVVLSASENGSLEAFVNLSEKGVDFSTPASFENPQDMWRFIDQDELLRLLDASSKLPDGIQRDLADLVESSKAQDILKEMALLEKLVENGGLLGNIHSQLTELAAMQEAGQTLQGISLKIQNAERQEAALVGALRSKLGGLVSNVGGKIDGSGSIILPDDVLFDQGSINVGRVLRDFLESACEPWLTVLKGSGVDISEIKIEGHASSEWRSGSSPKDAYLGNLNLSQRRSQAVLKTCLGYVKNEGVHEWARGHMIAAGYSSVRPILKNGEEDHSASRRVVFSVTPNRESLLEEIENEAVAGQYDRGLFGGWSDDDGDCRNRRQELLAEYSAQVVYYSKNDCTVVRGKWRDPYTDKVYTNARDVQIDHLVPLKWAWDRGASQWPSERRHEFANDKANLFVVEIEVNQAKGASGPDDWLPPRSDFHCEYFTRFQRIVTKYELQLNTEEMSSFEDLNVNICDRF